MICIGINVARRGHLSSVYVMLLERKMIDIAIVIAPYEDGPYQSDRVSTRRVYVLRDEASCSLEGKKVSIRELLPSPVVLPTYVEPFRGIIQAFARHNSQPCLRFVKPSIQDVRRSVMEDGGVVFALSDSNAQNYIKISSNRG